MSRRFLDTTRTYIDVRSPEALSELDILSTAGKIKYCLSDAFTGVRYIGVERNKELCTYTFEEDSNSINRLTTDRFTVNLKKINLDKNQSIIWYK